MSLRKGTAGSRSLSLLAVLSLMSALVLFLGQLIAFADPPASTNGSKITICHRTNSATNPYVEITVAREAADGLAGNSGNEADHFGEHKGPLASSLEVAQDLKDDQIEWGDIIPNVDDDGNAMPHSGLNWTAAGQAMWSAGCAFVAPPTSPPPTTPPPTTPPPTTPPPTTPPPDGDNAKITICHRTNSATNPYVEITVAREAADGLAGNSGNEADHFGEHKGPLASSLEVAQDLKDDQIEWGDIIPNVDDDGNAMPHSGLNWTAAGQAMWSAGCAFVAPPTSPPPTTPPPTTPPPTTPPPTTPPPTTPPPAVSVLIEKTNDANEDGIYSNNERSKSEGFDVDFKLVITNTSNFEVEIKDLTDSFGQTTLDLLVAKCAGLAGMTLDPDESVTCTFTLNNYSPAQGTAIVNVAEVCVEVVGGTQTDCDTNPSRVRTAVVLGQTVSPTPTTGPTRTPPGGIAFTGPESAVPLTALAFALLTLGMGLLWAGNRKRESYER